MQTRVQALYDVRADSFRREDRLPQGASNLLKEYTPVLVRGALIDVVRGEFVREDGVHDAGVRGRVHKTHADVIRVPHHARVRGDVTRNTTRHLVGLLVVGQASLFEQQDIVQRGEEGRFRNSFVIHPILCRIEARRQRRQVGLEDLLRRDSALHSNLRGTFFCAVACEFVSGESSRLLARCDRSPGVVDTASVLDFSFDDCTRARARYER